MIIHELVCPWCGHTAPFKIQSKHENFICRNCDEWFCCNMIPDVLTYKFKRGE